MKSLPEAIVDYWNANPALPQLWLEYAPEDASPPVAIFEPKGFRYAYGNFGFKTGVYTYEFSLQMMTPEAAYDTGFSVALPYMEAFSFPGVYLANPDPDDMSTPSEAGQANVWEYRFTIEFQCQVIPKGA